MRDLDEKSAEVELYHHARPYSNQLDFESRSSEKPSFRINERSLGVIYTIADRSVQRKPRLCCSLTGLIGSTQLLFHLRTCVGIILRQNRSNRGG